LILPAIFGIKLMAAEIEPDTLNDKFKNWQSFDLSAVEHIKILDLETAKKTAVKNNPSVLAVKERITQANERVSQAFSAILPSIDLSSSIISQDNSVNSKIPDPKTAYSTDLSLSAVLFSGFLSKLSWEYAKLSYKSAIEAEKDARRVLIQSVSQSFYNAQLSKENIKIAKDNIIFYKQQLKETEFKRKAGKASLSDIYNLKIKFNSGENDLITAKNEFEIALTGLAVLLGFPDASFHSELELVELETLKIINNRYYNVKNLMKTALLNRPDMKSADLNVQMADKNIGISKSDFYPTISLNKTFSGNRYDDFDFKGDDVQNSLSLNLKLNIFSWGATKAKVKEAESAKREAQLNYKKAVISLKSDLVSAVSGLKAAEKKHILQVKNTELVKMSRDLIEKEYKAGKKSLVSLNEAQNSLVKSQFQLAQSIVSVKTSLEKISSYTGENLIYIY
ncbi:MAG: TolC family protein, partial [Desulfobacula sp.]|nr:TolC family protein [Desulfobacula sp.]